MVVAAILTTGAVTAGVAMAAGGGHTATVPTASNGATAFTVFLVPLS